MDHNDTTRRLEVLESAVLTGLVARDDALEKRVARIEEMLMYFMRVRDVTYEGKESLSEALDNTSLYHSTQREKLERRVARVEDFIARSEAL